MKKIIIALLAVAALSSCSVSPDDVKFHDITKVDVRGATMSQIRMNLTADVENQSRRRITIKSGELVLSDANSDIAHVTITERVTIPKRFHGYIQLPIDIKSRSALGFLSLGMNFGKDSTNNLFVTGKFDISNGVASKKFDVKKMPLKYFLNMLGVDDLKSLNLQL